MGHCAGCAFGGMCGGAYPLREAMYIALMELDMDTEKLDDLYSIVCRFTDIDEKFPVEVRNIEVDDYEDEG
jgi:hypothetical protein